MTDFSRSRGIRDPLGTPGARKATATDRDAGITQLTTPGSAARPVRLLRSNTLQSSPSPAASSNTPQAARTPHAPGISRHLSIPGSPDSLQSDRTETLQAEEVLDGDGNSVQVFIRVRPCNTSEMETVSPQEAIPQCVKVVGETGILAFMQGKEDKRFTFDKVLMETSQQDTFEAAGVSMVDNCMSGYNSAIFVYGQTGSGKTYTMMGELDGNIGLDGRSEQRGLAPRVIELLFARIGEVEDEAGRDTLRYSCRCSCLEIYNETIADLLDPQAVNLQLREDPVKGIYVDGLCEKEVLNVDDVMVLMRQGNSNRHVGETNMNARSSRSHCVFTCVVERASKTGKGGATGVVTSRLSLIDLAGSERIKGGALGGSQAQGGHFKEAVHINQSLTTLGRVITELMEAQRPGKQAQGQHIPYRDSRLTFLLQDSLGGNAKTTMIANVSPSPLCAAETVSTLQFAKRTKCIRNHATINLNYRGDVVLLQREVARLNVELDNLRRGFTDPALQENKELRERLDLHYKQHAEDGLRLHSLTMEVSRMRKDRARMEALLEPLQASQLDAHGLTHQVQLRLDEAEATALIAQENAQRTISSLSEDLLHWRLQADSSATQLRLATEAASKRNVVWRQEREQLASKQAVTEESVQVLERQLMSSQASAQASEVSQRGLQEALATAGREVMEAQETNATLAGMYSAAREELELEQARVKGAEGRLLELEERLHATAERHASVLETERGELSREVGGLREELAAELASHAQVMAAVVDQAAQQEHKLHEELKQGAAAMSVLMQQIKEKGQRLEEEGERADALAISLGIEVAARSEAEVKAAGLVEELHRVQAAAEQMRGTVDKQAESMRQQVQDRQAFGTEQEKTSQLKQDALNGELRVLAAELLTLQESASAQLEAHSAAAQEWELKVATSECSHKQESELMERETSRLNEMVKRLQAEASALKTAAAAQVAALEVQQADAKEAQQLLVQSQQQLLNSAEEVQAVHLQLSKAKEMHLMLALQSEERQEQTRGLQRELIRSQENLAMREYRMQAKATQLEGEVAWLQRMQGEAQSSLETQGVKLSETQALLAKKERELSDILKTLEIEADDKCELEDQMKGYLVTNTRQGKAFQEIARLIQWATTPPGSARSSAMKGGARGGPDDGAACSPTRSGPSVSHSPAPPIHLRADVDSVALDSCISNKRLSQASLDRSLPNSGDGAASLRQTSAQKREGGPRVSLHFDCDDDPDVGCETTLMSNEKASSTLHETWPLGMLPPRLTLDGLHAALEPEAKDVNSPMSASVERDQLSR